MSATAIAVQPDLVEGVRSAIRATARSSFVLFLIAFTASAFAVLGLSGPYPSRWNLSGRFIGLAFAFSHLIHAVLIYAYGQLNTEFWPSARTVANNIPGGTAYAFILLMALTSFKKPARLLGRRLEGTACHRHVDHRCVFMTPTSNASPELQVFAASSSLFPPRHPP